MSPEYWGFQVRADSPAIDSGDPASPPCYDCSGATFVVKSPDLDNSLPDSWRYSSGQGSPGADYSGYVCVEDAEPVGFLFGQNFPNPFNPIMTIVFSLPEAGYTELAIYSITGWKVRMLVSGNMTAGYYSVILDFRD